MKMEDGIDTMDVEQMRKIRAQYMAHVRTNGVIGGYDLFDIYLVLYVLEHNIKGTPVIRVPFLWMNKIGGAEPVTAGQFDALSELLVVEKIPENFAGRIVRGLTQEGGLFLNKHMKELVGELQLFSLTEEMIKCLGSSGGASK